MHGFLLLFLTQTLNKERAIWSMKEFGLAEPSLLHQDQGTGGLAGRRQLSMMRSNQAGLTGMQALDDRGSINEISSTNHTHEMGVELRNFDAGGAMHFGSI